MLNIDSVTAQRRWPQALFARLESGWSRFKFWRRERAAAKEYSGRVLGQSRMQKRRGGGYIQMQRWGTVGNGAGGGGWLTGGNLARGETQEQEERRRRKTQKHHARSFKDASAARLMHTRTDKHTR